MATAEQWQRVQDLFHAALEKEPAERPAFLKNACGDDETLRREVAFLISAHETEDHFIDSPGYVAAREVLATHHFESGEMLAHYRIEAALGSGGMGEVYLAEDTRLNRKVALKLLPPHFTVNPDRVRRFEREARAASALNHPNIVTIYEIGVSDSTHFIATEFVDGKTLRQLMNEKPFTLNETLNVSTQVADALSGAHIAGIIHRDIKPENIMIRQDGYVKILDFGLAKLTEQQATESDLETPTLLQSNPGLVMGTVHYMSPEQARARNVGVGTDIWSLGIVMYELLAGQVPFTGETPSHVMVSLMEDKLPPLKDRANVPGEVDRLVTKALSKSQKDRFQTAGQIARDLKSFKQTLQQDSRLKEWLKTVPSKKDGTQMARLRSLATAGQAQQDARGKSTLNGTAELPAAPPTNRVASRLKIVAVATALVVLSGIIVLTYFLTKRRPSDLSAGGKKSIAVLPLKPINKTNRDEIYEIGIADSLIHRLSTISGLTVRPLSATRKYADIEHDPISVGKEQHVDYVLASNYQLADGKIRITSQLLNVASGQIEQTYRSEKYAGTVFATQDAIASEIENLLLDEFATTTSQPAAKRGTTNEEAYRLYLQAMYLYGKRTERASKQAVELLDQAVALDHNYATAWAGKAHAHRYAANLGRDVDIHAEYKKSMEAINRALALNKDLSEAYSALCENKYYYEFDFAGAEAACKRAVALDPNSSLAHEIYGRYLYHRGRFTEGINELETAVDLEPTSLFNQRNLGIALYYAGQYEKAKAQFKRVIAMDESFASGYSWLRNILEIEGNYAEAFDWFIKAQRVLGTDEETIRRYERVYQKSGYHAVIRAYVERFDKGINQYYVGALLYADLGNKDKAFEYLNIAYQRREWGINSLLVEPRLKALREDPRFAELVKKVGLTTG